jgi:hypothetical protein
MSGRVEKLLNASDAEIELVAGGGAEDLDAVASGNDQSFANHIAVDELAQSIGAHLVVEGESLADLDRSCFVIDSDK